MRVLLDECIDRRLAREIPVHDVATVHQMRWTGVKNGELLRLAAIRFDVFVTVDGKLPYQTTIANLEICVLVLRGRSSRLADLLPLVPDLRGHRNGHAGHLSGHCCKLGTPAERLAAGGRPCDKHGLRHRSVHQ